MQETLAQFLGQKDPLEKVIPFPVFLSFPGSSESKESACNAGDLVLIPGSGRSLGEGNGNPLQYFCLENSMDGGAWWAAVHGIAESDETSLSHLMGLPRRLSCKESACQAGNIGLILESGRSP